jgi:hypothetical protein
LLTNAIFAPVGHREAAVWASMRMLNDDESEARSTGLFGEQSMHGMKPAIKSVLKKASLPTIEFDDSMKTFISFLISNLFNRA